MDFFIIFRCLKDKKALKTFIFSTIIIAVVYLVFSIGITLLSVRPFPQGGIIEIALFGAFKAFSTFTISDWIAFGLFPLVGGLLFANCSFWRCKTKKSTHTTLFIGLLTTICPDCLLPIFGAVFFVTFLTKISIYIKVAGLVFLIASMNYVANSKCLCKSGK